MSRRLMKNIEDNCIRYDYSVRTSNGNIVQFKYGDDGLEPMKIEESNRAINFDRYNLHFSLIIALYFYIPYIFVFFYIVNL